MGISLAWVAVKEGDADTILARLGLERTGRHDGYPFNSRAPHAHPLAGGGLLVAALGCDHPIAGASSMASLSAGCEAVSCAIEEHVNYAACELWRDGARVWQVSYLGSEEPEEFSHEGALPARFYDLLAHVEPEDSDNFEGYFLMDIPLILAKDFAGYRHDDDDPAFDAVPFEALKNTRAPAATTWWTKLWR